ncbi:MAG: thiamine diphosphokinase [Ruminococcus sp.]|nr:thiamine diphosphokinase [Ruminococcus sp.]
MGTEEMKDICWILAGGPEEALPCEPVPKDAYILCADSGLRLAERLGIEPALVLGDFDSLGRLPQMPYIQAPVEKDDTDTMLAVRHGLEQGYRRFVICGAFGGRWDHSYANVQTLLFLHRHGAKGTLVGASDIITLVAEGEPAVFPYKEGFSLSVFAISEICEGVTIQGVKYPLENAFLTIYHPLGVSNAIMADTAVLSCKKGLLMVVQSRL